MTAVLYIILGLSIGIGITLIYLQERYNRERRLLVSMAESERIKSSQTIKELDEQWSHEREQYRTELQEHKAELEEMQQALSNTSGANALPSQFSLTERTELDNLRKMVKEREDEQALLEAGKNSLQKSLAGQQQVINELQQENAQLQEQLDQGITDSSESPLTNHSDFQKEHDALRDEIKRLKDALDRSEQEKEDTIAQIENSKDKIATEQAQQEISQLHFQLRQLEQEKVDAVDQLQEHSSFEQENIDLQQEITYLKGEVLRLQEEKKKAAVAADDDFVVLPHGGGHLLPGSVVRALLKK